MPVKLRSQRKRTQIVSAYCDLANDDDTSLNDMDLETEIRGLLVFFFSKWRS
jgi:hypothetical protein